MGEGAILDPLANPDLAALRDRVGALEARLQAIEPVAMFPIIKAFESGFPSYWRTLTTSAAYETQWTGRSPEIPRPGVLARASFQTTGTAAGDARVVVTSPSGTATSRVLSIPNGYSSVDALGWQHGLPLWVSGTVTVEIQARMTSGVGDIRVGQPTLMWIDPRGCTAGLGTWYLGGWLPNWT